MLWLATAELAAAVSNAGALGVVSPLAGMEKGADPGNNFKYQLSKVKQLTKKPFGVNIPLDLDYSGVLIDLVLSEKIGIVITAAGDPGDFTELLKQEGAKVLHVVGSVGQARHAERCSVDAVVVEGVEAGGHIGFNQVPLFSLIPQVADAVSIPIVSAGGIADARGMAAALVLGADGVQLGTRFIAVEENIAHTRYKQAIIEAKDTDTVITCRRLLPTRSLKTPFTMKLVEMDESGASAEEIYKFMGYSRARRGQIEGDLEEGETYCGSSAGLIKDIIPAAQVIDQLVASYAEVIKRLP
jgi:enoyl-[acyl-carrier protein] reductase II